MRHIKNNIKWPGVLFVSLIIIGLILDFSCRLIHEQNSELVRLLHVLSIIFQVLWVSWGIGYFFLYKRVLNK